MTAVLQPDGFLWLRYAIGGGVHLPHRLSLAVYLLNVALATSYQQIAFWQFLHRPWQETRPAVHLLTIAVIFVYAA